MSDKEYVALPICKALALSSTPLDSMALRRASAVHAAAYNDLACFVVGLRQTHEAALVERVDVADGTSAWRCTEAGLQLVVEQGR